jgi:Zn ribbon nucleic-acid-binding protein
MEYMDAVHAVHKYGEKAVQDWVAAEICPDCNNTDIELVKAEDGFYTIDCDCGLGFKDIRENIWGRFL